MSGGEVVVVSWNPTVCAAGRSKALVRKAAIWARVVVSWGQKRAGLVAHPSVTRS